MTSTISPMLERCPFCRRVTSVSLVSLPRHSPGGYFICCGAEANGCGASTGVFATEAAARWTWNSAVRPLHPGTKIIGEHRNAPAKATP